ncbi:hypothetical protein Anas_08204 [Armadillidium nasatum]|uniref:Uncharacterized protein n=1 Tax=Armadillidium nasatum TaxID=96803 RepID=A0A5N5SYX7_9CRUS|nr:hypothetical protein Anas_08204 [Armadillidium nasatum]
MASSGAIPKVKGGARPKTKSLANGNVQNGVTTKSNTNTFTLNPKNLPKIKELKNSPIEDFSISSSTNVSPAQPLDKREIHITDDGVEVKRPALSPEWVEKRIFIHYTRPPVEGEYVVGAVDAWVEQMEFLSSDLTWLLELPHYKGYKTVDLHHINNVSNERWRQPSFWISTQYFLAPNRAGDAKRLWFPSDDMVLNAILEDNLPPCLDALDRSMKETMESSTSSSSRSLSEESSQNSLSQREKLTESLVENQEEPYECGTLSNRLNIYDDDEFDVFRKPANVRKEKIHKGKAAPSRNLYEKDPDLTQKCNNNGGDVILKDSEGLAI